MSGWCVLPRVGCCAKRVTGLACVCHADPGDQGLLRKCVGAGLAPTSVCRRNRMAGPMALPLRRLAHDCCWSVASSPLCLLHPPICLTPVPLTPVSLTSVSPSTLCPLQPNASLTPWLVVVVSTTPRTLHLRVTQLHYHALPQKG